MVDVNGAISVFEGRMQLADPDAPELEVTVEFRGDQMVLSHVTGELGTWPRASLRVKNVGGGWFTLVLDDEEITFAPRRPGPFAGAVSDLEPPEEEGKKSRRQRRREARQSAKPSREERKAARAREIPPAAAVPDAAPAPVEGDPFGLPPAPEEPPLDSPVAGAAAVQEVEAVPETPKHEPAPLPEIAKAPKVKEPKPPKAPKVKEPKPPKAAKAPKVKEPKPPKVKAPAKEPKPPKPPREPRLRPAMKSFKRSAGHLALRISDQLRQTGIVPLDRLPGLDGRRRPSADHQHSFFEHRLPGGLVRNVCHDCGHVSIGGSD